MNKNETTTEAFARLKTEFNKLGWKVNPFATQLEVPDVLDEKRGARLWFASTGVFYSTAPCKLSEAWSIDLDFRNMKAEEVVEAVEIFYRARSKPRLLM